MDRERDVRWISKLSYSTTVVLRDMFVIHAVATGEDTIRLVGDDYTENGDDPVAARNAQGVSLPLIFPYFFYKHRGQCLV